MHTARSFTLMSGSGWVVGRLREGQHEHAQLNGWLSAAAARRRCEEDPSCGGFTYKGFLPSQAQAYAKLLVLFSLFKASFYTQNIFLCS